MKDKKFIIANRISFTLYILYVLTYITLPFVTHNLVDLIFLILPFMFTMGLIENILIKYRKIDTKTISKVSEIAAIFSTLINGFNSGALYVGTMDWEEKKKQIKKYPSIEPAWLFVILISTILLLPLAMVVDIANIYTISIFVLISIVLLIFCQVSSSFALYYNNGKDEMKKFWRNIIIVFAGFIIILAIVFYPLIKDMNTENKRKQDFKKHVDNINKTLNNN